MEQCIRLGEAFLNQPSTPGRTNPKTAERTNGSTA
jgi:hypothetical protein